MSTYVVLLRGINVGSHNRIPMADLRALLADIGHPDARTLVQSGNIVLSADLSPEDLAAELERAIADRFGVQTPVVVRTRGELAEVVALDPLGDVAHEHKLYQVSFLSAEPDPEAVAKIAQEDYAPECFVQVGREIYAWHPEGIHNSRLARMLSDKRLGVVATARNWKTTTKLLEMAQEHERSG
ncbi:MAG TPA: DUF1697 domain-containing protein [Solirubrobacteraceae bacterium]|jgi:uncharacterized protein (DUF1697 family)|nr:DUF1697 domain-containing protein [Solirubrobacteraceae bacterium]